MDSRTAPPSSSPTRAAILRAAGEVVLAEGVGNLTLAAVAREAGVSKGGLLYHFPSKQALVEGMIAELSEVFTRRLARALDDQDSGIEEGRWLRGYAQATFVTEEDPLAVSAGLLAAVANAPALLDPLRANFAHWQELAESDGLDPALGTLIRLAVEGLWFADLFGFAPPAGPLRTEVLGVVFALTQKAEQC